MRTVLLVVALTWGPATSAQPVQVTARPNPVEPCRFFGGGIAAVPLLIQAPAPDGLSIRAALVQLTSRLSAPAAGEIEVPLSGPELDLAVPLPAVSRETDFELRFRARRRGDPVAQSAGRVALRVYPADLLDPVRAWAESHPLRVEDDHGAVIELFRRQGIPVAAPPKPGRVTLYAGPRALQKVREGGTAVLFTERDTGTPHLVIDRTGSGTTVCVEMRLLDRLATDPLAQKILVEVFQHLKGGVP
jgi:hypothetical protein